MMRQQQIHSTDHRFRRDFDHWETWLNGRKLGQWRGRFSVQNQCRTIHWSPVKRICRPEQDHLRGLCCCREVHGSGIDCDEQLRLPNQRRQRKQICFPRKVDEFVSQPAFNCGDVLLIGGWPARQNKLEFVDLAEVLDYAPPNAQRSTIFPRAQSRDAKSRKVA